MSQLHKEWKAIHTLLLASYLIIGSQANLGGEILEKDQLFGPVQWRTAGKEMVYQEDLLVLQNGERLVGRLTYLPALEYSFGLIAIEVNDVASLAFGTVKGREKLQVITQQGENYVADLPKQAIAFQEKLNESGACRERRIDPRQINFFVAEEHGYKENLVQDAFHHLVLRNGDELPVYLEAEEIELTDGWEDFIVCSDRFVDVYFNGGVQGLIESEQCDEDMGFCFVKNPTIGMLPLRSESRMRLPWEQIYELRMDLGDFAVSEEELSLADLYREEARLDENEGIYLNRAKPIWATAAMRPSSEEIAASHEQTDRAEEKLQKSKAAYAEQGAALCASCSSLKVQQAKSASSAIRQLALLGQEKPYAQGYSSSLSANESTEDEAEEEKMVLVPETGAMVSLESSGNEVTNLLPTLHKPSRYVPVSNFFFTNTK